VHLPFSRREISNTRLERQKSQPKIPLISINPNQSVIFKAKFKEKSKIKLIKDLSVERKSINVDKTQNPI
jgi:hypothetical protein